MTDAAENRFRALKTDKVLEFYGNISDTTRFEPIKDLIIQTSVLDLAKLRSASFVGLKNFLAFLDRSEITMTIREVPFQVYRNLGLLAEEGLTSNIESFSVLSYDPTASENPLESIESQIVRADELMNILFSEGDFGCINNKRILHSLRHLCRPLLPRGTHLEARYSNEWGMAHSEEASFWYDYSSFATAILDISIDGISSLSHGLIEKVGSLCVRVGNAIRGLALLRSEDHTSVSNPKLQEIITNVTNGIIEQMTQTRNVYRDLLLKLHQSLAVAEGEREDFFLLIEILRSLGKGALVELVGNIEAQGAELTNHLLMLYSSQEFVEAFQALKEEDVSEDKLEELRDAFLIMDILSEGDFEASREEIITELTAIEADLMSNMVDLQTFDLTRQIIEHRIRESEYLDVLIPACASQDMPWEAVRDELLTMAGSKLVTDQEKDSFSFYFPYFQNQGEGLMPAGEVSFF